MIVVSACLAGIPCRYNGTAYSCSAVIHLVECGQAIPVCPEILGGLSTPRLPAEILDGCVLTDDGSDLSAQFQIGAELALQKVRQTDCSSAILKARSPSCGAGEIYDGSFSGRLKAGDGVFARLLKEAGIPVQTEEEMDE